MVGSIGVNSVIVPFRVVKFANIHMFRHGIRKYIRLYAHMYTAGILCTLVAIGICALQCHSSYF